LYQEPYQTAAAASAASGYQSQDGGPIGGGSVGVGGGAGGPGSLANGGSNGSGPNSLFASAASSSQAPDCIKYPQEF